LLAPIAAHEPDGHSVHEVTPAPEMYWLTAQHTPAPAICEYVSAAQGVQADELAPEKVPAGHVLQSASAAAPVVARKVPAGQAVHVSVVWPTPVPYLPWAHCVQSPTTVAPALVR
jgi:hypothetical protein